MPQEQQTTWWTVELEGVADFGMSMKRVYAWYENEIIARPPVRFVAHNEFLEAAKEDISTLSAAKRKAWWFDVETQVDLFMSSIADRKSHGETFPVFFPNLGPDVYAAFYSAELEFGEVTFWSIPLVREWDDVEKLKLDLNNEYFHKLPDRILDRADLWFDNHHLGFHARGYAETD